MKLFKHFSLLILLLILSACQNESTTQQRLPSTATVLALGDSLTKGYGASPEQSYPSLLGKKTQWRVINAGINGNTSAQALERLPALLDQHHPDFVLISIGGNDFLQRIDEQKTKANIQAIVDTLKAQNIPMLLIGIPSYGLQAALGHPKDHPMYQQIANDNNLPLLSHAWGDVLKKDSLKSDQVHPNAQGYQEFTQTLLKALRQQGFLKP